MKKYKTYKDSGCQWIGQIPQEWRLAPLKFIAQFYTGNSLNDVEKEQFSCRVENSLPYIATKDISATDKSADYENGVYIPREESKYKVAPKGSFLICIEGGSAGRKMTYLNQNVCFVNKLCCIDAKQAKKFLYYSFQSVPFQADFKQSLQGLIGGVSMTRLADMKFPLPTLSEQEAIVAYLDDKTGKIDCLVDKLRTRIEDLKKYRQSIITESVTHGLNPNAQLKDSGIQWIGQIPQEWKVSKLKYLLNENLKYGANESSESDNRAWPRYIRITDIAENGILKSESFKSLSPDKAKDYMLKKGDVLFARSGATVGKSYLFNEDFPACYAGYLIKASCGKQILPEFLIRYTQSNCYENWKNSVFILSTIQNIGADKYSNLPLPLPSLPEQEAIVEYLDRKTTQIDTCIAQTETQIEDLQKYRQALITEAVTGQIDVRN